jgi:SAM-dependent methyltransferase
MSTAKLHPQRFLNGEVHDWYRIILGYSDHLVGGLLDEFDLNPKSRVLDPFCGSGTTLVEGMKRGLRVTGLDANPASCFAAKVKTNWSVDPEKLRALLPTLHRIYQEKLKVKDYERDHFYRYLRDSGYLRRWVSLKPVRKIVALRRSIRGIRAPQAYKDVLMLALAAETVHGSSNVRFGPELCCKEPRLDSAVFLKFQSRVRKMCNDLILVNGTKYGAAFVLQGDSRNCGSFMARGKKFAALISSPPYPTEHDYTRNSRLELALLGYVKDLDSLRAIKKQMIRSHTKGIYANDADSALVKDHQGIQKLVAEIDKRALAKTHGFARLYSRVLCEYFGGLKRHFTSVLPLMMPGAMCAYVVGDQSSYLQVRIPTAKLLAEIAVDCGFEHVETRRWRSRWSTTMSRNIVENILLLRAPGKNGHGRRETE